MGLGVPGADDVRLQRLMGFEVNDAKEKTNYILNGCPYSVKRIGMKPWRA